jgi:prepilin-type N-terminal cleavage/methylation domain-containing protein
MRSALSADHSTSGSRALIVHRLPRNASYSAFTLIELSIVVLVLSLLAAVAMRYVNSVSETNAYAATNATLDAVETALLNYRNEYGRLPCTS